MGHPPELSSSVTRRWEPPHHPYTMLTTEQGKIWKQKGKMACPQLKEKRLTKTELAEEEEGMLLLAATVRCPDDRYVPGLMSQTSRLDPYLPRRYHQLLPAIAH